MDNINWDQLCQAYEDGCWQRRYYLDRVTGETVCVTEATRAQLQDVYDQWGEEGALVYLDSAELTHAHTVEMDDDRFLKVPEWACVEEDCDAFAAQVAGPLQRLLWRALEMRDWVYFERVVGMDSAESTNWHNFKRTQHKTRLCHWLDSL